MTDSVIDDIRTNCGSLGNAQNPISAGELIDHLDCVQGKLLGAPPDPTQAEPAEALANEWKDSVGRITDGQGNLVNDSSRLLAAADDINLHAQLVLACQLLEAFAG